MSLEPRFRHTCDDAHQDNSLLYRKGSNILPLPCGSFNPPSHTSTVHVSGRTPSNLGVELKADASTCEYERHRACLSVKTSTDEPSHVPLHARTLRGAALSSWWTSLSSLSAQAACRGFRGLMEALSWYWRCTALFFFVFKCGTVYLNWWKTGMRGYFLFTTALRQDLTSFPVPLLLSSPGIRHCSTYLRG